MNSLRALADAMRDDEFVAAMERFVAEFPSYRPQLPLIPYSYTRTRLERCDRYEVVAMRWSPGSTSPIHDHGESRCWVLMLEGALEVENFEPEGEHANDAISLRETGKLSLRAGDLDYRFGPKELHRVRNAGDEPAYSLQLYAAPIDHYRVVDGHTLATRIVTAAYDLEL